MLLLFVLPSSRSPRTIWLYCVLFRRMLLLGEACSPYGGIRRHFGAYMPDSPLPGQRLDDISAKDLCVEEGMHNKLRLNNMIRTTTPTWIPSRYIMFTVLDLFHHVNLIKTGENIFILYVDFILPYPLYILCTNVCHLSYCIHHAELH